MSLSTTEAAVVYAALVLHDDGLEITADRLNSLISAAGIDIEGIWATLFAKALAGKDVGAFLFSVGSAGPAVAAAPAAGAAAPAAAAGGSAPAPAAKKEEKKVEKEEESDDDMGFGLFD